MEDGAGVLGSFFDAIFKYISERGILAWQPDPFEYRLELLRVVYSGVKISLMNETKETPLQAAARTKGEDLCRSLIALGDDVNERNADSGASLMHFAAMNKENGLHLIKHFRSLGLEVDAEDKFGDKPIHYAIKERNFDLAEEILHLQNEAASREGWSTLLSLCVSENRLGLAKIVHENKKDTSEREILQIAARQADLEMFKWLHEQGFDKEDERREMLNYAAVNKKHGITLIPYLVSVLGYDVNAKSNHLTALHYAVYDDNVEHAQILLALGADLSAARDLIHFSVQCNKLKSAKLVHSKNQELVTMLTAAGENCLHLAAEYADVPMCEWLVEECDLNPQDLSENGKESVLHFAAMNKTHGEKIIDYFSKLGLDLNAINENGHTPLHLAISNVNVAAVEQLLSLGADAKVKHEGADLLHFGIKEGNIEICKTILEKCPKVSTKIFASDLLMHTSRNNVQAQKIVRMN